MTDEELIDSSWEPWVTEVAAFLEVTDSDGSSSYTPFSACAPTFEQAKNSMKIHLGMCLRQQGYSPAWIRGASE